MKQLGIQLRKATLEDLKAILQLFADAVHTICKNDYDETQIEIWASAALNTPKWTYRIETQYFLVAEIEDILVGFASLEGEHYLDLLYVHKDYLNRKVATSLYRALIKEAKIRGANQILTDVSITARPFLEREGFQLVHENKNSIQGVEIINYKMRLEF